MTNTQIEYFLEVAESGSFSKTAEKIFVSQQVISSQIKALEKELGIELFDRTNRRNVNLTAAGRLLFERWKKLKGQFDQSIIDARGTQGIVPRKLRIGIEDTPETTRFILPRINKMGEECPGLAIEYEFAFSSRLEQRLHAGKLDMIVVYSTEVGEDDSCVCLKDNGYKLSIVMSKDYHLASRDHLTLNDIREEPFFTFSEAYSKHVKEGHIADFKLGGVEPPANMISMENFYALETAVSSGKGVTLSFIEQFIGNDHLKAYPIDGPCNVPSMSIILVWRDKTLDSYAEMFRRLSE